MTPNATNPLWNAKITHNTSITQQKLNTERITRLVNINDDPSIYIYYNNLSGSCSSAATTECGFTSNVLSARRILAHLAPAGQLELPPEIELWAGPKPPV